MKIMDGGHFESQLLFDAGADYVTVLGARHRCANNPVLHSRSEGGAGKQVVVDMICVDDLPARVRLLEEARICWRYTGTDQQAARRKPIDDLITMLKARRNPGLPAAGGITRSLTVVHALLGPDVVIVGSAITHAADPADEARRFRRCCCQYH